MDNLSSRNLEEEVDTKYTADEAHMGSFVSSFVSLLAEQVETNSRELTWGEKDIFAPIGATSEAEPV